jgi:hypothetical protein
MKSESGVDEWMDGLSGHDGVHLDRHDGRKGGFEH